MDLLQKTSIYELYPGEDNVITIDSSFTIPQALTVRADQ
jgi:hypothetical protein